MTRNLRSTIIQIQREVGVLDDGIFGPVTAANVLAALRERHMALQEEKQGPATTSEHHQFDERTEDNLRTLDAKAQPAFRRFIARAQAIAASLGCDYIMISGTRTWAEQDELYNQRPRVTNAPAGYSWHNFGVAGDFGVFQGRRYLDADDPAIAARVHKACSMAAKECGLAWGGNWESIVDLPHYQLASLPDSPMAVHRATFKEKGSVL